MIRSAAYSLLACLLCLLARPGIAQRRPAAVEPLAPVVVQLVPGDVVRERLVGLDSATYQASRHALELVPASDAVQASLRHQLDLSKQETALALAEVKRCRDGHAALETDYQTMRTNANRGLAIDPRPPWLLDGRTYKVGVPALIVGTLLGLIWAK